jgi:hypothetical protein
LINDSRNNESENATAVSLTNYTDARFPICLPMGLVLILVPLTLKHSIY